ncbi:prophage side tail fiber protein homolog StfR-like isoform X2 [Metopolophium dirhodum]|nr:prophage side tail fiber protein homolog StfR-like isoform X2 [Metopolophium dirhodum]
MVLWPVDEVFTADATAPPPAAATVSSAVASASSAIATASSAIAKASTAIATASSAIATASSAIATDPSSSAAVDAITCDDDTADLCDTSAAATSAETSITTSVATSTATSAATSAIAGDDCSTVASALRLGHGADDPTAQQVDDDRGGTGRGLDIVGPSRLTDRFNRVDVRPRTVGVKITEKVILTAVTMFFEKFELALYMSLYKLKLIYTTVIAPVLGL